jgi:hypothetical protein
LLVYIVDLLGELVVPPGCRSVYGEEAYLVGKQVVVRFNDSSNIEAAAGSDSESAEMG